MCFIVKYWFGIALIMLGLASFIIAIVWQQVLCFQRFGAIFDEVFIPHWSAFFYLGFIPMGIGYVLANDE